jgi:hypothetical protein
MKKNELSVPGRWLCLGGCQNHLEVARSLFFLPFPAQHQKDTYVNVGERIDERFWLSLRNAHSMSAPIVCDIWIIYIFKEKHERESERERERDSLVSPKLARLVPSNCACGLYEIPCSSYLFLPAETLKPPCKQNQFSHPGIDQPSTKDWG